MELALAVTSKQYDRIALVDTDRGWDLPRFRAGAELDARVTDYVESELGFAVTEVGEYQWVDAYTRDWTSLVVTVEAVPDIGTADAPVETAWFFRRPPGLDSQTVACCELVDLP